jgi:cell division protein FtsI (penicillin-binding protein 3)
VATFVGFVPADNPRLVILVAIDEPKGIHYGGLVAGPVFRDVGKWALNYFRVNPQIRLTQKAETTKPTKNGFSREATKIALSSEDGILPDFKGLGIREVLEKAHSLGLNVLVEGSGLAVKQTPGPGVSLKQADTLKVRFRPPT